MSYTTRPGGSEIPAMYHGYHKELEKLKIDIRKKAKSEREAAEKKTTEPVSLQKTAGQRDKKVKVRLSLSRKKVKARLSLSRKTTGKDSQGAQSKRRDKPAVNQHLHKIVKNVISRARPDQDPNDWQTKDREEREFRLSLLFREAPRKCHFLLLPLEIREQIYGYLLEAPEPIRVFEGWSKVHRHKRQTLETAIMRTNSQIADECIRVLYGQNTFEYLIRDSTGLKPSPSGRLDGGNGHQGDGDTGVGNAPDVESDSDDDGDGEYEDNDDHSDHEGDEYEFAPVRRSRRRPSRATKNAARMSIANKRRNTNLDQKTPSYNDISGSPTSSSSSSSRASQVPTYTAFNPDVEINVAKFGHHFRHIRIKAENGRSGPHYRARMAAAIAAFSNLRPRRAKLRTIDIEITPTRQDQPPQGQETSDGSHDLTFLDFFEFESDILRALRVLPCQFIRVVVNTHAGPRDIVVDRRQVISLRRAARGERDIWAGDVVVQAQRRRLAEQAQQILRQLPQTIRQVWLAHEVQGSRDVWDFSDADDEDMWD
ncbi:hypothetical protein ACRALDRAFT_1078818 [Sodiomyces alcalophilus JCM 7366]|uniref:uncharacterized protein n=1 Tax=Sodiomyces alcalophilus JCM 7366 TaxID=591952 RepID=UPI0039B65AFD